MSNTWTLETLDDDQYDLFDDNLNYIAGLVYTSAKVARLMRAAPQLLEACQRAYEITGEDFLSEAINAASSDK
jgi:hypothetical protein